MLIQTQFIDIDPDGQRGSKSKKEGTMEETIKLEMANQIAKVILNKPKNYNAFDLEMITHFANIIIPLATNKLVSGVIITGTGKAFCAGGDLNWASHFKDGPSAAFHELSSRFHQAILEIRRMNKPVIAAINGIAAGGGFSLALACDFRMMARSATLRQGFTSNGLSIDGGGYIYSSENCGPVPRLRDCSL